MRASPTKQCSSARWKLDYRYSDPYNNTYRSTVLRLKENQVKKQQEPLSLQDAAYKFATTGETTRSLAQYVLEVCPDFLNDVPKEVRQQIYAGFQLKKHELTGDKFYKLGEGGTYIPLPTKEGATVVLNINSAMSYSPQEFGKIRDVDPAKHGAIKTLRDSFSDYASNNMKALVTAIRNLVNEGKPRERSANKGFREALNAVFDAYDRRVRTAKDRGDVDADPVRYRVARDIFWKTYDTK